MPVHQNDFKPARSPCGLHKLWPTLVRPLQVVIRFLVRASPKSRGGQAGLVIMSLFYLVNMTTKILVAEQSYTHLVTKES